MTKKHNTPFEIFLESIGLYFSNFDKFIKYMTFPVLGQILGLIIIFSLTLFYNKNMTSLLDKFPNLYDTNLLLITLILLILPGLIIFLKAFWEYLVAYGAINSMLDNMLKSGKVYDFTAHTELIKRRTTPFIGLWLLFSIFSLISICPLFWIICGIFAIFFVLVFQVFTFEPEQSPIGCAKRSLILIKGHFASTFLLMALVGSLTYVLIPQLADKFFAITNLTNLLTNLTLPLIQALPLDSINNLLTQNNIAILNPIDIAKIVVTSLIAQIFIQYTLPLRSILWGMWYRELNGEIPKSEKTSPSKTKKIKRPSEKLMKESHKKFATKKIDRNLLKRAMKKDENKD